jgi:hypothetical protein
MPTTVARDSVVENAVSQEGEIQSPFVAVQVGDCG